MTGNKEEFHHRFILKNTGNNTNNIDDIPRLNSPFCSLMNDFFISFYPQNIYGLDSYVSPHQHLPKSRPLHTKNNPPHTTHIASDGYHMDSCTRPDHTIQKITRIIGVYESTHSRSDRRINAPY
jgi:hypothetical protein